MIFLMSNLGNGLMIMKTRFLSIFAFAAIAVSCAKEVLPENNPVVTPEVNTVPMSFVTSLETKAAIVDGEKTVEWQADDAITIFDNLGGRNTFTTSVGGATSEFTGVVTEGSTEFYALYPERTSAAEFNAETKVITSKLFPEQTAVLGSYAKGNGGAVMVAKSESQNLLVFKNMTSHIRFTLAEELTDVVSITLMGNKGEAVAGLYEIDYSGDEPTINVTEPETYVTLSNGGNELAPGDYFFTLLPVEFAEGFTVILSRKDGRQLAKKTTREINSLNVRNQILPMAKLSERDYKSHMNYFVKYNDGFPITIGGYTFSKKTNPGGKLVNDTYGNGNISTDGIFFIDSFCTTAQFNKAKAYSSLIVVGADENVRSNFNFHRQGRPFNNGNLILLANLDCTVGDINAFRHNADTEGHAFADFGDLILYNCHFRNVGKNFFEFNKAKISTFDLHVELCEFGFKTAALHLFNVGSYGSAVQSFALLNNIFYVENGTTMTDFKLTNGDSLAIDNVNVDRNTFANTTVAKNIMKLAEINATLNFARNLFVACSGAAEVKLIALSPGNNKANVTGIATNNYYYTTGSSIGLGVGKSALTSMEAVNSTAILSESPLGTSWNPAQGTYGPYTYGSGVSNTVGAWRSDMKVVAEPTNYAAAGYSSMNMGNL